VTSTDPDLYDGPELEDYDLPTGVKPGPWIARANCAGVDPDLFFPQRGDGPTVRAAKQVCAGCAVRTECAQHAIDNNEPGIWGGTTGRERRTLRRNMRLAAGVTGRVSGGYGSQLQPVEHGTTKGYHQHKYRGDEKCRPCMDAYNADNRARRAVLRVVGA